MRDALVALVLICSLCGFIAWCWAVGQERRCTALIEGGYPLGTIARECPDRFLDQVNGGVPA